MLSRLAAIWRVPELWQKILLTIGLLAVYRLGFHISLPFINHEGIRIAQQKAAEGGGGGLTNVLQMMSLFSASNLTQGSLFGLGIMPYITASIVFQLLGTVYPPLEQLQKEGESGRRRINEYTRYATVFICLLQSFFIVRGLESGLLSDGEPLVLEQYQSMGWYILGALLMTCGTVFLMWIGEQIDTYGIGNGISLLIMAGILAQMPTVAADWVNGIRTNGVRIGTDQGIDKLLVMAVLFVGVIVCVIFITQGQRKIPIQSARHVRGRKVMGGQRQWLPLRVNQAGVMPIIFASSLLLLPFFVLSQIAQVWPDNNVLATIASAFTPGSGFVYNLTYIILIYFFCYFWTAITFNPKDMADNLKDMGSFIPGYRPGARTAVHLEQVMTRVTYAGAAFLAIIAVIPTVISTTLTNNDFRTASFFGGTGLLIIVSVALDLVQKIDSHLIMRNYPGLLDADD